MPFVPEVIHDYIAEDEGWKFLPYRHLKYFRCNYGGGSLHHVWSCVYCKFWCEIFDTDIMYLHLCRRYSRIPPNEREELRTATFERLRLQLQDIYDVSVTNIHNANVIAES